MEWVFQQAKSRAGTIIKEVICLDKKLKQTTEWLALMHKQMIEARKQQIGVTKVAWIEIMGLKKDFHTEAVDLKNDSHARVSWLWDEL